MSTKKTESSLENFFKLYPKILQGINDAKYLQFILYKYFTKMNLNEFLYETKLIYFLNIGKR